MHPLPVSYKSSAASWPTNAFDEIQVVERQAHVLEQLACAASTMHNHGLADQLFQISDSLCGASKSMRTIVGNCVDDRYKDAQQGTANMLKAVMTLMPLPKS